MICATVLFEIRSKRTRSELVISSTVQDMSPEASVEQLPDPAN